MFDTCYNDDFFYCVAWTLGSLDGVVQWLEESSSAKKGIQAFCGKSVRKEIKELAEENEGYRFRRLEELVLHFPSLKKPLLDHIAVDLAKLAKARKVPAIFRKLQTFFDLDKHAFSICLYAFIANNCTPAERYFEGALSLGDYDQRVVFAKMLDIPKSQCGTLLSNLVSSGIIDADYGRVHLTDSVAKLLRDEHVENFEKSFCSPAPQSTLRFSECNVSDEEKKHILQLMRSKDDAPKHILLYGFPGTGKTTFASCLAQELGVSIWAVAGGECDSVSDRRVSLTACVKLIQRSKGDFILIDEAEYLLSTDLTMSYGASHKSWLNPFLEQKNVRIIWITNFVEHIEPAVRRRFTYSIYFPKLTVKDRTVMLEKCVKRLKLTRRIANDDLAMLAKRYPVELAVMENAFEQAKAIAAKADFLPCVERILSAQVSLQNNGRPVKAGTDRLPNFTLEACCTKKPVEQILATCRKMDSYFREKKSAVDPGVGTMLFYGPPGTGKTALAHYIAEMLDRSCVVKRASDLLGSFVGETEKNIAEAFAEAMREDAVLVIDEADSFLQSRESAVRSWEITEVNEFLTQLENCRTFCICTTNFREHLDVASQRRFSVKVAFDYARPPQIELLYQNLLAPLAKGTVPPDHLHELVAQKNLTPGDFNTVRHQFFLEEPGTLDHATLVAALLQEVRMKPKASSSNLGFH